MSMERRISTRTQRKLQVIVEGDAAETADVTANGLCVETVHVTLPGKSVTGTINVGERAYSFSGIVCWSRGPGANKGRMGVRFVETAPGLEDALGAE